MNASSSAMNTTSGGAGDAMRFGVQRQGQQLLLESFPFIALGLVGLTLAAFLLLGVGLVNRTHVNLWVAVLAAFIGGITQLADVIQVSARTGPLMLVPGLVILQGIALGFFVNFKLFFLYRRVQQPGLYDPPTPDYPLPYSHRTAPPPRTTQETQSRASEMMSTWARLLLLKPFVWLLILSTGFIDSTWRVGFPRNGKAFTKVYEASNAFQLILQIVFGVFLVLKTARSRGRPRMLVYCSILPLMIGILFGISIAIAALAQLGFTETPTGRLVIFLQMYVFLLETSLNDFKRPFRDSLSFDRILRKASSSSDGTNDEVDKGPPELFRSPLDRAASAADFRSLRAPTARRPSEASDANSLASASTGNGIFIRRGSQPPSWLPVLRSPEERGQPLQEILEERLSLTIEAEPPARRAFELEDSTGRSILFVQSQQQSRAPATARTAQSEQVSIIDLSAYRFPESPRDDEDGGSVTSAAERVVFSIATPVSRSTSRRSKPALTIDTAISSPSAVKRPRMSKALPDVPPDSPRQAPTQAQLSRTTTATTFRSNGTGTSTSPFPLEIPPELQHPTNPLDLARPRAPFPGVRQSEPVSIASSTGGDSIGTGIGEALDRFPQPPPSTAALHTRTATKVSVDTTSTVGKVRTREGSEFDIVPPRRLIIPASTDEGVEHRTTLSGLDITSLFSPSDDAHGTEEQTTPTVETSEDSIAGRPTRHIIERPPSPLRPPPPIATGLPVNPATYIPVRVTTRQPPRPWPPLPSNTNTAVAAPGPPPPMPAPYPPTERKDSDGSTSSTGTTYPPSASVLASRRPSAVALAAARIRAENSRAPPPLSTPAVIAPLPPAATSQPQPQPPASRLARFVFPLSNAASGLIGRRDGGGSNERADAGGGGGTSRIFVQPSTPYEFPRKAPMAFGERFEERKEQLKRVASRESGGSEEKQEVIGVDVITDEEDGGQGEVGAAR